MLSKQDNERLVRVGPGTPMGELMRRYWLPALIESEIETPDSAPLRLRLLGEDLVAFRATSGRVAIMDAHCPHRRAQLYFGRNEEEGIRCVYHGWKFNPDGQCVDMPSEPPERQCPEKISIRSYPTELRGGGVWVYMGPEAEKPALPDFEGARLPAARRTIIKRRQDCNWAQAVEGGIDSSHVSFLHSASDTEKLKAINEHLFADKHPVFEVEEQDYGLLISARRGAGPEKYYWRVTQFLLPFWTMIPPTGPYEESSQAHYEGHAWVPIDDYTTWTWTFGANPHHDYTSEHQKVFGGRDGMWGPVDENYNPLLNIENDYGLDRDVQKKDNFTGIQGIPNQDCAVQESMGRITDRSLERLGSSDRAIVSFRRLLLRLSRELEEGKSPASASNAEVFGVRSASVVLPRDVPIAEGAKSLINAGRRGA